MLHISNITDDPHTEPVTVEQLTALLGSSPNATVTVETPEGRYVITEVSRYVVLRVVSEIPVIAPRPTQRSKRP
jgi:hypothetical protein